MESNKESHFYISYWILSQWNKNILVFLCLLLYDVSIFSHLNFRYRLDVKLAKRGY